MRALTLLVAAAAAHGLAPFTTRLGTVAGSAALVLLAVLLALAASAAPSAIAVASGALGAFASGVVAETGPALAGALLVALCFAERSLRVREPRSRALHVGLAAAAGALAAWLSVRYVGADALVRVVVVVVAAVLTSLPLLVAAEDPIAFALEEIAREVPEPARASLAAGAELRRSVDESLLDRESARDASKGWSNLLRLAEARARMERPRGMAAARSEAVLRRLDQRVSEHVESLTKMYTAADAASAATLSLDDTALQKLDSAGASLDEVSKAIVEDAL
jgi:hypothetical protein